MKLVFDLRRRRADRCVVFCHGDHGRHAPLPAAVRQLALLRALDRAGGGRLRLHIHPVEV